MWYQATGLDLTVKQNSKVGIIGTAQIIPGFCFISQKSRILFNLQNSLLLSLFWQFYDNFNLNSTQLVVTHWNCEWSTLYRQTAYGRFNKAYINNNRNGSALIFLSLSPTSSNQNGTSLLFFSSGKKRHFGYNFCKAFLPPFYGARIVQWWEHSPPTNVARVSVLTPYVGWACC